MIRLHARREIYQHSFDTTTPTASSNDVIGRRGDAMGVDSVGSLLADIAGLIVDGLRILGIADKRHWGQDEHELLRAMERVLDDAKKDFQELSPLAKGQAHYERDRSCMPPIRV